MGLRSAEAAGMILSGSANASEIKLIAVETKSILRFDDFPVTS
jgi:hypothetical protein